MNRAAQDRSCTWLSLLGACALAGIAAVGAVACAAGITDTSDPSAADGGAETTLDAGSPGDTAIPTDPTKLDDAGALPRPANDSGTKPPTDSGSQGGLDASFAVDTGVDANVGATHDAGTGTEDAGKPPVDAGPPDASPPPPNDGSVSAACVGVPQWTSGTSAPVVQNLGEKYTCIQAGWCEESGSNADYYYAPGTGMDWQQAWADDGPCD